MTPAAAAPARVEGWDLLRGLCALAVAAYHLLHWQGVADLYTLGSYGVYLFFLLSGASLAYTYGDAFRAGRFRFDRFLFHRYMRLAPLYLLLMGLTAIDTFGREGFTAARIWQGVLNAAFLFGFDHPATSAWLIGGWSLGIEVIFYLIFPLLLWALQRRWAGWAALVALVLLQAGWILATVGSATGYAANAVAYHHAPAFGGYFMTGCVIGLAQRRAAAGHAWSLRTGGLALAAGAAVLLALTPARQGDELLGWRGVVLPATCAALVLVCGRVAWRGGLRRAAVWLGDATYGLYLLHPVLYFSLAAYVLPRLGVPSTQTWPVPGRIAWALVLIGLAFGLAVLSERWLEQPLRRWSKRLAPASAS